MQEFITEVLVNREVNGKYTIKLMNKEGYEKEIIELNNILEVFMKLYKNGEEKITHINEQKYMSILENIDNEKEKESKENYEKYNKLKDSWENKYGKMKNNWQVKYDKMKNNYQNKYDNIENDWQDKYDEIEDDWERKYDRMERNLHDKIKIYENKINNMREDMDDKIQFGIKNKIIDIEHNKNIEINFLNKQLESNQKLVNIHEKLEILVQNNISTQEKGMLGEDWILTKLQNYVNFTSNSEVRKISGKKEVGDIYFRLENLICCVESKNHTNTIRLDQIAKFKRDLDHDMYNCGLFVSLKSDMVYSSGIQHFDIKLENNKPCIYLTNLVTRNEHLQLAIRILTYLVKNIKQNNYKNIDYIEKLKDQIKLNLILENDIKSICKHTSNMKILLNKNKRDLNIFLGEEKEEIEEIEELNKKQFICDCNKDYKTKAKLNRHRKNCKKFKTTQNTAQQ